MEQVEEMKNICVDGVALSGMVMETLGEKFDQMHQSLKRKMTDQIEEIKSMKVKISKKIEEQGNIIYKEVDDKIDDVNSTVDNIDSNVDDITNKMETVEAKIEEMAIELSALHGNVLGISDKVDQIYKFLSR
jgi:methyl-accepting chemotaxis protein